MNEENYNDLDVIEDIKLSRKPKFSTPEIVKKVWGEEIIFASTAFYCGKILRYNKGAKSSLHFHGGRWFAKKETLYCISGDFMLKYIDGETGAQYERTFKVDDVVELDPGVPHEIFCLEAGDIFEVSTKDDPENVFRLNSSLEKF